MTERDFQDPTSNDGRYGVELINDLRLPNLNGGGGGSNRKPTAYSRNINQSTTPNVYTDDAYQPVRLVRKQKSRVS